MGHQEVRAQGSKETCGSTMERPARDMAHVLAPHALLASPGRGWHLRAVIPHHTLPQKVEGNASGMPSA
eukprot:6080208-Alexandrium_andersonii.AAC.1